jgi:hypothetical protein
MKIHNRTMELDENCLEKGEGGIRKNNREGEFNQTALYTCMEISQ